MRFYLGTDNPAWLARTAVPLFVSHRRLAGRKTYPRAAGTWALDSGGFTEVSTHGRWLTTPEEYVSAARTYRDEIGGLAWAAPQDWMCEPWITEKTGMTVAQHQALTVANYLRLRDLAPDVPFAPVLQGWEYDDYDRCVELYDRAGVDLAAEPVVGVGSVCRRQSTGAIAEVFTRLHAYGLRLHGFGVKTVGLSRYGWALASADSMAWSYTARRQNIRLEGCTHRSVRCSHCLRWALRWRERVLKGMEVQQPAFALTYG